MTLNPQPSTLNSNREPTPSPNLTPNKVGGNSGPQTLHRSELFVAAPEQYPLACPDSDCSTINATAGALAQMNLYAGNAAVDALTLTLTPNP